MTAPSVYCPCVYVYCILTIASGHPMLTQFSNTPRRRKGLYKGIVSDVSTTFFSLKFYSCHEVTPLTLQAMGGGHCTPLPLVFLPFTQNIFRQPIPENF